MTLQELMNGITVNPSYEGAVTADDYVLAINLADPLATEPDGYLVAQKFIIEHSGTLNPETSDSTYIRSGTNSTKTGNQRQISINGDRYVGDAFQDAMLSHAIKFGTGQTVVAEYVYFNIKNGKGEKGELNIMVEDDPSGAAGENASFSATLYAVENPAEYAYVADPEARSAAVGKAVVGKATVGKS